MTTIMKILNRYIGETIWDSPCATMKETAVKAVAANANLCGASLRGADLRDANLCGASLCDANLCDANLCGANLCGANLCGANLCGANLCDAKNLSSLTIAQTRILPAGVLIGWKKCRDSVIVKLEISADAKRSHAFGRKCRAEFVKVLEVFGADIGFTDAHGPRTEYRAGAIVRPDSWCDDFTQECANGIHFYITREEAEAHV